MEANIVDLVTLFNKPVSYRIPQFQRPYAWKEDSQWKPLWEDISGMADRILKGRGLGNTRPHFMGAIVLQSQDNKTGEVEKRMVVDGQQRLTTLQLLIKAVEYTFHEENENIRAARLRNLTLNEESHLAGDDDNDTKVRQANRNDQSDFQRVIRDYSDGGHESSASITSAFNFFKKNARAWLKQENEELSERADALEQAITKNISIAAIDLDKEEEPHIIFETLNERGEPLTQADKVKNTVLYKAKVTDDAVKARQLWGMFENTWWRENSSERRLIRIQNDRFLNHWLEMKTGDFVASDRVAARFRNFLKDSHSSSIDDLAADIRTAGQVFRSLEEETIPEIRTFWRRVKTMEIGVVMPLLLWLYTTELPDDTRKRSVWALESYLVRRMLCGVTSQGLNRLFLELLTRLKDPASHTAGQATIDFLRGQTVDNRIWPTDESLYDNLVDKPLKGTVGRQLMVLKALELHMRSNKTEGFDPGPLTREHIMPQTWQSHWLLLEGSTEEATAKRDQAIREIGNLTLVTGRLNPSLSNSAWNEKRDALEKHTALRLNWELLKSAPEVWNEEGIRSRSRQLTNMVTEIWPYADKI